VDDLVDVARDGVAVADRQVGEIAGYDRADLGPLEHLGNIASASRREMRWLGP
jgi:hypothetical protein